MRPTRPSLVRRLAQALTKGKSPLNRTQYLIALIAMMVVVGAAAFLEYGFLPYCNRLSPVFGQGMGIIISLLLAVAVGFLFCVNYVVLRARLRDFRAVDESRLESESVVLFICMFIPGISLLVVGYLLLAKGFDERHPSVAL